MTKINYPVFEANIILKGKIKCVTGLHIGGSKEKLEIGGVDSPILRNPQTNYPYIPGSSLKGKLRHLLEFATGAVTNPIGKLGDVSKAEEIVRLFGIGADEKDKAKTDDKDKYLASVGPARLIVRDCNPDDYSINMWQNLDSELLYTEYKPENTIDRLTSAANPRFIERVVADSRFDFEIIYGVYRDRMVTEEKTEDEDGEVNYEIVDNGEIDEATFKAQIQKDLDNLLKALRLLENNFLGKSGSRGYGQVKFSFETVQTVKVSDYQTKDAYAKATAKQDKKPQSLAEIELKYEV